MLRLGYVQIAGLFLAGIQKCPVIRVHHGSCEEHVRARPRRRWLIRPGAGTAGTGRHEGWGGPCRAVQVRPWAPGAPALPQRERMRALWLPGVVPAGSATPGRARLP